MSPAVRLLPGPPGARLAPGVPVVATNETAVSGGNDAARPNFPILPAFDTGKHSVVWCDHCRRWHFHSRGDGHRVAHCADRRSPYDATGYSLRCVGAAPPAVLKDLSLVRPKGPARLDISTEARQ